MQRRWRRLDLAERTAFARAIILTGADGRTPRVIGAERLRDRGGRVLTSLGGMYIELALSGFRPDIDLRRLDDVARVGVLPVIRNAYADSVISDADVERVAAEMVGHWRDGHFAALDFARDGVAAAQIGFEWKAVFEEMEIDGVAGRDRWPTETLLDYWILETGQYADSNGRW